MMARVTSPIKRIPPMIAPNIIAVRLREGSLVSIVAHPITKPHTFGALFVNEHTSSPKLHRVSCNKSQSKGNGPSNELLEIIL